MPKRNVCIALVAIIFSLFIALKTSFKEQIVRNVAQLVYHDALTPPPRDAILEGALSGIADSVDDQPYTAYIPPVSQSEYMREMQGQYAGVGISNFVRDFESGEFYFTPLRNSPASKAGLKFGDRLVAVDGQSVVGKSIVDVMTQLRGKENECVELTLRAASTEADSNVPNEENLSVKTIKRELIQQDVVSGDRLDDDGTWIYTLADASDIGYVAVEQFSDVTGALTDAALSSLLEQNVKKLILDFRGNPGGSLQNAVEIANALLADGSPIVETRDSSGRSTSYVANLNKTRQFQTVVLIDEESASASEIVAAALQDADAATVVGVRSYGKGTVQSIYELPGNMGALRMTTASFWRPSGRPIHRRKDATEDDEWGVVPNPGCEVKVSIAQKFYTRWMRRMRLSQPNAAATSVENIALTTQKTNELLKKLRDGDALQKTEAAFELGIDPSLFIARGSNSKENEIDEFGVDRVDRVFRAQGRTPYFDPQLDRAIDLLRESSDDSKDDAPDKSVKL